jgi:hypothetical protein
MKINSFSVDRQNYPLNEFSFICAFVTLRFSPNITYMATERPSVSSVRSIRRQNKLIKLVLYYIFTRTSPFMGFILTKG